MGKRIIVTSSESADNKRIIDWFQDGIHVLTKRKIPRPARGKKGRKGPMYKHRRKARPSLKGGSGDSTTPTNPPAGQPPPTPGHFDQIGGYIESIAREAEHLRRVHGGRKRWWVDHNPKRCRFCLDHDKKYRKQY